MGDITEAARRAALTSERQDEAREMRKSLRLTPTKGGMFARCIECPHRVFDRRRPGQPVFASWLFTKSGDEAFEWFRAHRLTDMHKHYRSTPWKMPRETDDERLLREIEAKFGKKSPRRRAAKAPFEHVKRWKGGEREVPA